MRLVLDQSPAVVAWVASRIPQMTAADFGPASAIGVVSEGGTALGGVVFHNYQPRFANIEVSFAADSARWLTRNLIRGILAYPFEQLDCQRITSLTPRKNKAARRFVETFGFKLEGVVRLGFKTDDMIISGLLRRDWLSSKWMKGAPLGASPNGSQAALH